MWQEKGFCRQWGIVVAWVAVLLLPAGSARANEVFVWFEGEDVKNDKLGGHPFNDRHEDLSGGKSVGAGKSDANTKAEWEIDVPEAGDYYFYVRKFWHHGPFQFRWNDGNMGEVNELPLLDSTPLQQHCVNWVSPGKVELKKGKNTLVVEAIEPYGPFAIDCFVVSKNPFVPNGTLKPGEKLNLAEDGKWAFEPDMDMFEIEDAVGLSEMLNETVAGASGYVKMDKDGDFVDGQGKPIRFWCVNTGVQGGPGTDALALHAKHLAKRGVNMIRHFGAINPKENGGRGATADQADIDKAQKAVAVMKREGIYTTLTPYWAGFGGAPPQTTLFWDESLQRDYKSWIKDLLTKPNPYDEKKTPLGRDPALAIFNIQNEDSLFFWTTMAILKGEPLQRITARYHAWRAKNGLVGTPELNFKFWEITNPNQDHKDTMRFFAELQREWHVEVERFLREECGCKALVNAGNWRTADQLRLLDLERYSYTANGVIGVNRYVNGGDGPSGHFNPNESHKTGYMIRQGDYFQDVSTLLRPLVLATNGKQVAGHAYIIPESTWVPPFSYQSEGPLLVAAYSALNGIDGYYWFALGQVGYDANINKWQSANPAIMGGWPAAALMFRKGYIKKGEPVVHEERALDDLWNLTPPVIAEEAGYDANRDIAVTPKSAIKNGIDPQAYLVGPVEVVYDGDPGKSKAVDLSKYIEGRRVKSITGELMLDAETGLFVLDAPKAQGVTGFLNKAGEIKTSVMKVDAKNDYATVMVVPLDDKDIAKSGKILVQVTTRCRPYGWRESEATYTCDKQQYQGKRIDSLGNVPWNVWNTDMSISLRNGSVKKATVLDANLYPTETKVEFSSKGGTATLIPPADAVYVLLD